MSKIDKIKDIIDANLEKMDISNEAKKRLREKADYMGKNKVKKKFRILGVVAATIILALLITLYNSKDLNIYAIDLMENITPREIEAYNLSDDFILSTLDFSIELFKHAYDKDKNSLISPTSVLLALAITANGADGETLEEFQTLLGGSDLTLDQLNKYYYSMSKKLTKVEIGEVNIANSIWYSQELDIKKDFLQTNGDYYSSDAYKVNFKLPGIDRKINDWVKNKTKNKIDKIVDEINPDTIMHIINAIYFKSEWKDKYMVRNTKKEDFYVDNNKTISVDFMSSNEYTYLKDNMAQGFMKLYKYGEYSFVALLPDEGISIESYINSMTGEGFLNILNSKLYENVFVSIPKFKFEFDTCLISPLIEMGLNKCFSELAGFSKMVETPEGIFIGKINHKTFIEVNEGGTEAAALTDLRLYGGVSIPEYITFNRPFVFAIVNNETNLPLFIGTMNNPSME
ncbi:UNVERIFIED_CONTAM: serpin B [Acetivibrio alkalicellulosi]